MASVGHIAVGLAAARLYEDAPARRPTTAALVLWPMLSFLPDADVIGFSFGVRYADEWGHRGATHSLVFACAVGVVVGLASALVHRRAARTTLFATLVLATHPLLDTLTDGGLGCALLWPFNLTRFFAPWRPLPVAPIGAEYLSLYGMYVAACELTVFAPLIWFAFRTRSTDAATRERPHRSVRFAWAGAWVAALWLLLSSDPAHARVVGRLLRDDTQFAAGFSEEALDRIATGMTTGQVESILGEPFRTMAAGPGGLCWLYSRSPDGGYFQARAVCFDRDRVALVVRRWLRE